MAKFYSENCIESTQNLEPSEETVKFLLSYSKALSVINCKNMEFEALLN